MLTANEKKRYCRQMVYFEKSFESQVRLGHSHVVVVGLGGLGSLVCQYLAAAGVGEITLYDHDKVEWSNLPRQLLYTEADVGCWKSDIAKQKLSAMNGTIKITPRRRFEGNEEDLYQLEQCHLVIDCSDNFTTRYNLNQCCMQVNKTLISGAANRASGYVIKLTMSNTSACLGCVLGDLSTFDGARCHEQGILGPITGSIASFQSNIALRTLLAQEPLEDYLINFDGEDLLSYRYQCLRDPHCTLHSTQDESFLYAT